VIALDDKANGSSVPVSVGTELDLTLAENPTTGYRWQIAQEPTPCCVLLGDRFVPGQRTGAPGLHTWRWRAAKPGTARLEMQLRRQWGGAGQTFAVTFVVR